MNFLGCASCHRRDFVLISDRTMVNEDEEEVVTYLRESRHISVCKYSVKFVISNVRFSSDMCKNCDHVIARHEYTFTVVDDYQVSCAINHYSLSFLLVVGKDKNKFAIKLFIIIMIIIIITGNTLQ